MVLRQWESEALFNFVKQVDKGRITNDRERFGKLAIRMLALCQNFSPLA